MQEEKQLVPQLRFSEFEEEWVEKRLEKLFSEFKSGQNITSSHIKESGEYPVFGGNGLRGYINEYTHDGNYFLIGRQGALCGNINKFKGKAYFSEHAIACRANETNDTNWLSHRLEYFSLNRLSESSAQPGLSVGKLLRFKLIIPLKEEQQKIANFLTAIDNRIQTLEKKKTLLEQYKKGVMQKIFKQELRFKDEYGKAFPEWEEKKLGEVCSKKSSNISANKIGENFGEYIIYGASGVLKKVDFYKEENDYVSIIKDGAGVGRIVYCKGKSSVLGTMEIIKPNSKLNTYFLYCLLENVNFKKYITGSTIPHIYFKDYKKEKCNIPPLEEQTKIANFLSAIDISVELVTKKIEHTKTFKKGLLQQMFV